MGGRTEKPKKGSPRDVELHAPLSISFEVDPNEYAMLFSVARPRETVSDVAKRLMLERLNESMT